MIQKFLFLIFVVGFFLLSQVFISKDFYLIPEIKNEISHYLWIDHVINILESFEICNESFSTKFSAFPYVTLYNKEFFMNFFKVFQNCYFISCNLLPWGCYTDLEPKTTRCLLYESFKTLMTHLRWYFQLQTFKSNFSLTDNQFNNSSWCLKIGKGLTIYLKPSF